MYMYMYIHTYRKTSTCMYDICMYMSQVCARISWVIELMQHCSSISAPANRRLQHTCVHVDIDAASSSTSTPQIDLPAMPILCIFVNGEMHYLSARGCRHYIRDTPTSFINTDTDPSYHDWLLGTDDPSVPHTSHDAPATLPDSRMQGQRRGAIVLTAEDMVNTTSI